MSDDASRATTMIDEPAGAPAPPANEGFEPEIIVFACHYCAYAAGCLEGECHYLKGNLWARKRIGHVKTLLEELGIDPKRVEMFNMSSAMGARFAETARGFTERIRKLGPNPVRPREGFDPAEVVRARMGDAALPADDSGEIAAIVEEGLKT